MNNTKYLSRDSLVIPMPETMYKYSLKQRYVATEITIENQSKDGIVFEKYESVTYE